jgi:AsmA protein
LGLGCLLLGMATFIFVAAPIDGVRDRLVQDIKARTGRDFVVSGSTSLTLFSPTRCVFCQRLSLGSAGHGRRADPEGAGAGGRGRRPVVVVAERRDQTARAVTAGDRAACRRAGPAQLGLCGSRSGAGAVGAGGHGAVAGAIRAACPGGAQLAAALEKLFPTSVRVIDGTVRYIDERAGVRHEFGSLELELVANDIGGPLEAKGDFAWRGEKMEFVGACRRYAPCWRSKRVG